MIVYHGSLEIVTCPEIRIPNRTLDYGTGFYTTTSLEQATMWVKRKMQERKAPEGFVNSYSFSLIDGLFFLQFNTPTEEWLDFVMRNRTDRNYQHSYDMVYGPVANDKVYAAFALYEGGLLTKQNLIEELKTYTLVDQYLLHTEKSLQCLSFIQADRITL